MCNGAGKHRLGNEGVNLRARVEWFKITANVDYFCVSSLSKPVCNAETMLNWGIFLKSSFCRLLTQTNSRFGALGLQLWWTGLVLEDCQTWTNKNFSIAGLITTVALTITSSSRSNLQ